MPENKMRCHQLFINTSKFLHFLKLKVKVKSLSRVQDFVIPWTVCSLPGSSVHRILQARVLEWIAISSSRRSSQPRDQTQVSRIVGRRFTIWATRGVLKLARVNISSWSEKICCKGSVELPWCFYIQFHFLKLLVRTCCIDLVTVNWLQTAVWKTLV